MHDFGLIYSVLTWNIPPFWCIRHHLPKFLDCPCPVRLCSAGRGTISTQSIVLCPCQDIGYCGSWRLGIRARPLTKFAWSMLPYVCAAHICHADRNSDDAPTRLELHSTPPHLRGYPYGLRLSLAVQTHGHQSSYLVVHSSRIITAQTALAYIESTHPATLSCQLSRRW